MSRLKKTLILSIPVVMILMGTMSFYPNQPASDTGGCVAPGFVSRLLSQVGLGVALAAPSVPCTKHPINTSTQIGYQCDSFGAKCTDAQGTHGVCQEQILGSGFPVPVDCVCAKLNRAGGKGHH